MSQISNLSVLLNSGKSKVFVPNWALNEVISLGSNLFLVKLLIILSLSTPLSPNKTTFKDLFIKKEWLKYSFQLILSFGFIANNFKIKLSKCISPVFF